MFTARGEHIFYSLKDFLTKGTKGWIGSHPYHPIVFMNSSGNSFRLPRDPTTPLGYRGCPKGMVFRPSGDKRTCLLTMSFITTVKWRLRPSVLKRCRYTYNPNLTLRVTWNASDKRHLREPIEPEPRQSMTFFFQKKEVARM